MEFYVTAIIVFICIASSSSVTFLTVPNDESPCPNIVNRTEWGARPPKETPQPLVISPAPYVVVHHGGAKAYCTNESSCAAIVRSYQNYHLDTKGWDDIGYSFLVGEDGNVYEGTGWNAIGTHAPGYNSQSIGVCFIGDFTGHLHVVTVANRRIWQNSWVNDKYAVMADTSDEYFTMQGLGDPVSASGQGEKAGSQASSSNDCSSSLVGNLATGEYTITGRKLSDKTSSLQKRRQKSNKRTAELLSEELEERKKKRRLYMKNYRAKQSKEATQARLQHLRQSAAERRDTESEQAKKARLQQMRQHAAETRDSESELAKEARLQQMRQHAAETQDSESELAKQARLQQVRQHDRLPNDKALQAFNKLMQCGLSLGHLPEDYLLIGHRQVRSTECPGAKLYEDVVTWPHWTDHPVPIVRNNTAASSP